jgi:hypothetical protein
MADEGSGMAGGAIVALLVPLSEFICDIVGIAGFAMAPFGIINVGLLPNGVSGGDGNPGLAPGSPGTLPGGRRPAVAAANAFAF